MTSGRKPASRLGGGNIFKRASFRNSALNLCLALMMTVAVNATSWFLASDAHAEVSELRLARQYGISHLAMALMDQLQLVQGQAEKAGLKDLKVSWTRFSDGPGMMKRCCPAILILRTAA
jgi:hypothetical protein